MAQVEASSRQAYPPIVGARSAALADDQRAADKDAHTERRSRQRSIARGGPFGGRGRVPNLVEQVRSIELQNLGDIGEAQGGSW